jgi:hypothetical protein
MLWESRSSPSFCAKSFHFRENKWRSAPLLSPVLLKRHVLSHTLNCIAIILLRFSRSWARYIRYRSDKPSPILRSLKCEMTCWNRVVEWHLKLPWKLLFLALLVPSPIDRVTKDPLSCWPITECDGVLWKRSRHDATSWAHLVQVTNFDSHYCKVDFPFLVD